MYIEIELRLCDSISILTYKQFDVNIVGSASYSASCGFGSRSLVLGSTFYLPLRHVFTQVPMQGCHEPGSQTPYIKLCSPVIRTLYNLYMIPLQRVSSMAHVIYGCFHKSVVPFVGVLGIRTLLLWGRYPGPMILETPRKGSKRNFFGDANQDNLMVPGGHAQASPFVDHVILNGWDWGVRLWCVE